MRKVIVSMNVTLDGFMAGDNGELDWSFGHWNEQMSEAASETLHRADTILLGRITYEAMAAYWPTDNRSLIRSREDIGLADLMNRHRKVVFSKTLSVAGWDNSQVIRGDVAGFVRGLKATEGKDLIVYGSGSIVLELIESDLVDECQLWVYPVVLGCGRQFPWSTPISFKLLWTKEFPSGVVALCYKRASGSCSCAGISVL